MIKKLFRFTTISLCLVVWSTISYSQDFKKIDSLKVLLDTSSQEQKHASLEKIAKEYLYNNVDSCIKYGSILLVKATKSQDTLWMANAEKVMGGALCISGNLSSGLKHNLQAKEYFHAIGYEKGIYGCTQNIGFIYNLMDEPDKAIKHFHLALPYFEKNKNYQALDVIYNNLITSLTITDQLDSASFYLNRLEKTNVGDEQDNNNGLSSLKADLYIKLNQLDSAKAYYSKEYEYAKSIQDDYQANAALIGLGKLNKRLSKYATALNYFETAEEISLKNNYTRTLAKIYENKAEIYDSINNYKAAYIEINKLQAIKSEISNTESEYNLADVKIKYESENRKLEFEKQKAILSKTILIQKNKEAKNRIIFIAIGFIILCLLVIMYFKNQSRNKLKQQKLFIESQQNKIVGSINYAKRIQDSILRPQSEIKELFPASFVFFKPKDILSGDFYWFKEFGDVKIIATIDCIGHGVPGAFMSLIANNLLEKHATADRLKSPGIILEKLHEELRENANLNTAYQGMDMSLSVIFEKEKELYFAGARNSAFIVNQGSFHKLEAEQLSIGAETRSQVSFKTHRYNLQRNDVLYMYTDGFIDQFGGEKSKKLNNTKFKNLIGDLENIKFKNVPNHINNFLKEWQGNIAQTDDILIFGVKVL